MKVATFLPVECRHSQKGRASLSLIFCQLKEATGSMEGDAHVPPQAENLQTDLLEDRKCTKHYIRIF